MKLGVLLFKFIDSIFEHGTLVLEDGLVFIKVDAQGFILLLKMVWVFLLLLELCFEGEELWF